MLRCVHDAAAPHSAAPGITMMYSIQAEAAFREAGRALEVLGVTDAEAARLAPIAFRLAQRVAVGCGRLEAAP